jgi:hypothetical protein
MNAAYWFYTAWMWKCRLELARFHRATGAVAETQAALLRAMVEKNGRSEFGRAHHFATIQSVKDFQRRVPLANYESLSATIDSVAAGEKALLTAESVQILEPTSGSSGGAKLIPYTASLRAQFQRGIDAWLGDLLYAYPAVRQGRAYWSVSPVLGVRRTSSGGIPIGFDDDTAYLGGIERFALKRLLAVPPELSKTTDPEQFRYQTLLYLLAAEDLALISIWSPTFLTVLLGALEDRPAQVGRDLKVLLRQSSERRAVDVARILDSSQTLVEKLQRLWPRLALISCWADGASARYYSELKALFPHVLFQPKGLLSTEGFVSLPLDCRDGAALALRSHFFEFIDDRGNARLAHELESGSVYQVVMSTGGGLYRYRTGDAVEVVGFELQCPLLRFIGRGDGVCDRVGEKLTEIHVRRALEATFTEQNLAPRFAMVVPVEVPARGYRLYVQGRNGELNAEKLAALGTAVEGRLGENPYYDHAVRFGQLAHLEVRGLSGQQSVWQVYERECLKRGQKLGDIKAVFLHGGLDWAECLEPLTEMQMRRH